MSCTHEQGKISQSTLNGVDKGRSVSVESDSVWVVTDSKSGSKLFFKDKSFTNNRGDSLSLKNAKLIVPKGSIKKDQRLSITELASEDLPPFPIGMVNVTPEGKGYRFLPHGEHFCESIPAKVVMPFDSTRIPKGYSTDDIQTFYYD